MGGVGGGRLLFGDDLIEKGGVGFRSFHLEVIYNSRVYTVEEIGKSHVAQVERRGDCSGGGGSL